MPPNTTTKINIRELYLSEQGAYRDYEVPVPHYDDNEFNVLPGQSLIFRGYKIDEGISMAPASETIHGKVTCHKCLKKFKLEQDLYPSEMQYYLKTPDSVSENEEYGIIERKTYDIDLSDLLAQVIFLKIPPVIVCKPHCKGLCPKCGTNLNKTSCNCKNDALGVKPFSSLKELLP